MDSSESPSWIVYCCGPVGVVVIVMVGVIVIVDVMVGEGVMVTVAVRVGVGVSVANIAPSSLPGLASQTTSIMAPIMTSATAPYTRNGPF